MAEYPKRLEKLLEEFDALEDADLRSDLLIEFAEKFNEVPKSIATRPFAKEHLVPGCESEAYLWCSRFADDLIRYYFAVENPQGISAKALAAILDETLSGEPSQNVALVQEDCVYKIFGKHLSMGKGQGLMSMIRLVKYCAERNSPLQVNA